MHLPAITRIRNLSEAHDSSCRVVVYVRNRMNSRSCLQKGFAAYFGKNALCDDDDWQGKMFRIPYIFFFNRHIFLIVPAELWKARKEDLKTAGRTHHRPGECIFVSQVRRRTMYTITMLPDHPSAVPIRARVSRQGFRTVRLRPLHTHTSTHVQLEGINFRDH